MFRYFTLDSFDFSKKTVGVRVDINSPIIDGKIVLNERIVEHSQTLKELSKKGAKVVILAHQGRKGDSDCVSLLEHSKFLSKEIGKKVEFIDQIYSKKVEEKIKSMKEADILLLENLRFIDDETEITKKDNQILKLEKLFDYYVIDAFSVAHRKQTSMTGFSKIPLIAGKIMEKELLGLNQISELKKPSVYVLGGAKPDDLIEILEANLSANKIDYILLSGVIGEIGLMTQGYSLGKKEQLLKEKDYLKSFDRIYKLIKNNSAKFVLPKDVAIFDGKKRIEIPVELLSQNKDLLDKYPTFDIGKKSIEFFANMLKNSGSIYFKGPAGNFEDKNFEYGSREIIKAIIKSGAFTYMGGGHSITAVSKFAKISDFSYVSLAGGALVHFLSGKNLPGVEVLQQSFEKYESNYEDFLVVGSNTLDICITAPVNYSQIHLGDKIRIEEDFKTTVGGGGINVSICLSRLGAKVNYLGKISFECTDKIHDILKKDKVGIVEAKLSKRPCAKSILLDTKDDDRIIFTYRGQNSYLEEKDFDINKISAKNIYFNSLSGQSFQTMLFIAKHFRKNKKNTKICFNPSSHLIANEKNFKTLAKCANILVLNLEEAQSYSSKITIDDCLKEIKKDILDVVVITDGANGAFAYDGEIIYYIKAIKPKKIVDTTGAGDGFAGTFFYFYTKGFGIQKSLEMAAKNSSSVIEYKGAQDGLKYYSDLSQN